MEQTNPSPAVKESFCVCAKKPHLMILCALLLVSLSSLMTYILVKSPLTNPALLNPANPVAKVTPPSANSQTKTQTPVGSSAIPPLASETAGWKTYNSADIYFKYPTNWILDGFSINSSNPKIRISIVPKDSTLMNECMQKIATENNGNLVIKKFSRVTTGAMCSTSDSTPREIWIVPSEADYSPGISYSYLSTDTQSAESIFDKILSTFKFN